MTTDIKELVKYLRDYAPAIGEDCTPTVEKRVNDAADALEVLAGKVERLKETITTAVQFNEGLAAERDRLQLANARMKAALDEAVKWMDGCAVSGGYPKWHAKARKALGGDA